VLQRLGRVGRLLSLAFGSGGCVMSTSADSTLAVPAIPVLRSPKGPTVCSLQRPDADTLVLGPARASGWPSRANMSLSAWLLAWALLGFMIVAGALLLLLSVGLALTLPLYWAWSAWTDGAGGQVAGALLLEAALIALVALAVLALASRGRWVTLDRRQGLLTVRRRPFGWRRPPAWSSGGRCRRSPLCNWSTGA
jgi:hypothetical protein